MNGYLVSVLMGVAVGVAYGLVQVRSPAPPPSGFKDRAPLDRVEV